MHPRTTRPHAARAFTIAPLVVALFFIFLFLVVVYTWMMASYLSTSPPGGLSASGVTTSVIIGAVIGVCIFLVVVSVLALVTYFITGKNDGPANFVIGIFLLLGCIGSGFSSYRVANAPPLPKQATMADQMRANSEKMKQGMDADREALQRQSNAASEAMNRHNQAARDAAQRQRDAMMNRPTTDQPSPPAPASAPPAPNTPGTTPSPRERPSRPLPAPTPSADDLAAKPILDALGAEITKQVDEVAASLTPVLDQLSKPPKQDIREIKKRIADIAAVREPLALLSKRLSDMSTEGDEKLKAAGINSVSAAHSFTSAYKAMPRSFAADSLLRMLDDANTEATILRDNIGRWSIGRDGKIESKDFSVKSKANSARFKLEASLDRKNQLLDDLKGR